MNKLLRASIVSSAFLLTAVAGFVIGPAVSYAMGTADMEARLLSEKVVPETEISRILAATKPSLCSTSVDATGGEEITCEEKYPDGARVTYSKTAAGRFVDIFDKNNKLLTRGAGIGDTDVVKDPTTGEVVAARDNPDAPAATGCGMANLDQCILNIPGYLFSALGFLLLTLSSIILGIAGTVFNWVVIRTVFQFALYFGTSAGMLVAWGVLRDIANIALLFTFIFVGIATILNTSSVEGYTAKKALPQLIIFAVLLNFSLFATQAVIDVANGFSSVFATYAGQDKECNQATSSTTGGGQELAACANLGISSKILEAAGMHQIFPHGDQAGEFFRQAARAPYSYTVMLILLSLMVTITAMVLLAAAIMLIIRVVVLSLLMVTSPIGFAGMAIPALHKIAQDWWSKLINQAFFAPLFLLMVFVSLKLVEGLQSGQASIADAMLGNTGIAGQTAAGNMQVIVVFMIVIGFMIGALMIAQKMGAYGASFATKTAAGLTFGAHGFVARRTAGRLSAHVATSIRKSGFGETNLGRLAAGVADRGASASFSSRNLMGGMLKGTGVDFGSANKTAAHGYHGIEEKAEKERMEYAKSLRGNRDESLEEATRRLQAEREAASLVAHNSVRTEAEAMNTTIDAHTDEATATAARDAQRVVRDTAANSLANQRAAVAANPTNAAAQLALTQAEDRLARETRELTQTEEALARASSNLAAARTAETNATNARTAAEAADAAARAARPERRRVDHDGNGGIGSRERQLNFARSIQHEGDPITGLGLTAATHANHAAAVAIIQNAGRDEFTRAADLMREGAARAAAATPATPAAAAPAAGAGGPAPTHGHP